MARTTNRLSPATRPNAAVTQPDTNGPGSFDEQDQRGDYGHLGDNPEHRDNLTAVRDAQDKDRDGSRDNRDNERGTRDSRGGREFGDNREERNQRDGDAEQGSRREQRPTSSAGLDAFAPVLEAWKQVFTSWSELTETMVKAQRDAFASMIGAADTTAKNIKDAKVGERRNGETGFSGSSATASPTTASTPDRVEHDRR